MQTILKHEVSLRKSDFFGYINSNFKELFDLLPEWVEITYLGVPEPIFFRFEPELIENRFSHASISFLVVELSGSCRDLHRILNTLHIQDPVPRAKQGAC